MFIATKSRTVILKCGAMTKSQHLLYKSVKQSNKKDWPDLAASPNFCLIHRRLLGTNNPRSGTSSTTGTNNLDRQHPQRSILEEVLIKEEEQAKTTAQKVKKGAESTFFYAALIVSLITLGGLTYLLFEYFFSAGSPQRVYSKALKIIRNDPKCQLILGDNIAGFGEQTRRSRRHIVSHTYKVDNEDRVRVTFHVKGSRNGGRVFVEVAKKAGESWEHRFLFIELADRSDTLVLIDNRS